MTLTWKHCNLPYKKLNMTEYKTDMIITKIEKYQKKSDQYFYDGA